MKVFAFTSSLILIMLSPLVDFAQVPDLGSSSNFALFTSDGAFNNVGASNITGDIGTNVGALSGFPPGILNGTAYVANPVSAQASFDLAVAYAELNALTCDLVLGTTLGNDQTLTPAVYCLGGASSLSGNLYLDGQGDPNALFYFKIDGALTTDVFSAVALVNSASMANVFWMINGEFQLGDDAVFQGTVINNGAINLMNRSQMEGRALSKSGAINISEVKVATTSFAILPISLLSFEATCTANEISLNWSTASETTNDFFTIERSTNGENWETLIKVNGMGTSSSQNNYSCRDVEKMDTDLFYRLLQTDFNGNSTLMKTIFVENCTGPTKVIEIYPNPSNGIIHLTADANEGMIQFLTLTNAWGEIVLSSNEYQSPIDISHLPSGIYFLRCLHNDDYSVKRVVLEK